MSKKKIYLATPVNGRKEKTLAEKMKAARKRIVEMQEQLKKFYPDATFRCSFDIIGLVLDQPLTEAEIMGACVRMVMESDMIVLDDGWECSQGCTVERFVAMQYGKQVYTMQRFRLKEKLDEQIEHWKQEKKPSLF